MTILCLEFCIYNFEMFRTLLLSFFNIDTTTFDDDIFHDHVGDCPPASLGRKDQSTTVFSTNFNFTVDSSSSKQWIPPPTTFHEKTMYGLNNCSSIRRMPRDFNVCG